MARPFADLYTDEFVYELEQATAELKAPKAANSRPLSPGRKLERENYGAL